MQRETIKISNFLSTGLDKDFERLQEIEIVVDEREKMQGAFGRIYPCTRIDQKKPPTPVLIKVYLDYGHPGHRTIQKLQKHIIVEQQKLAKKNRSFLNTYPALLAIPLFSFEGRLNNTKIKGYGAYDLNHKNYVDFKHIIENKAPNNLRDTFYNTHPLEQKLKMGYDLINALCFLWSVKYIHADIKADALFIDITKSNAAFIDYDGGAFFDGDNNDKPATFGAAQDWLAPEIRAALGNTKAAAPESMVGITSDIWSANVMLYYIFFGFSPYYFLKEMSEHTLKRYLKKSTWPDFDATQAFIGRDVENGTDEYQKYCFNQLPAEIQTSFQLSFNEGYFNKGARCTLNEWVTAFRNSSTQPKIIAFNANPMRITEESSTRFTWQTENQYKVYLQGVDVSNLHEKSLPVSTETYILKAFNYYGKSTSENLELQIDLPNSLIPEFRFSRCLAQAGETVYLKWKLTKYQDVRINGKPEPASGNVPQIALKNITASLTAKNFFGQEIKVSAFLRVLQKPTLRSYNNPLKIRRL